MSERRRPLKMLVLHWDDYPTAIEVYLGEFPRRGHHVTWLVRAVGETEQFIETPSRGVCLVECQRIRDASTGNRPLDILVNRVRKLRGFLRKWWWVHQRVMAGGFDVVQARDQLTEGLIAWSVARLSRTPFAFQIDYFHFEGFLYRANLAGEGFSLESWRRRFQIRVRDWLMRRADLVFVISTTMRDECVRRGLHPGKCVVFPVGVSECFMSAVRSKPEAVRELNLEEHPYLVYLGNLGVMRDADYIASVMAGVVTRHPQTRLIIVGAERENLVPLLTRHGILNELAWAGRVDHEHVPSIVSAANVGIFPLRMDDPYDLHRMSSPLKVAEYLACGVPCVSSAIPEAVEILEASSGGLVVEDDVDRFAEATVALIVDQARARKMGESGREFILRWKSTPVLAKLVEQAYFGLRSGEIDRRSRC